MNDHFVLLSGPATCDNMAPWMLKDAEAELAGKAAYRIPTLKDVDVNRVSNLGPSWMHKEWFLAKAGTSYHQQGLKNLMATKPPFLSSDTEFLNHFSNPSLSKKLPAKALGMVMQVLEAYVKTSDG